jgi:hypothetical protein
MVYYLAFCIRSTGSGTRILAPFIDTGFVAWTLWIDDTLWPTVRWSAYIIWQAGAGSNLIGVPTLGVGSTGAGLAWIDRSGWWRRWSDHNLGTSTEWVSSIARWALTDWIVVDNLTTSIVSTGSWTGVPTLLVKAGSGL